MTIEPWDREPDEVDFTAAGLRCAMRRSPLGCWCGYVGVPKDHPWFGLPFNAKVKIPQAWLERPRDPQSFGIFDVFLAAVSGDDIKDGLTIAMALEVHGGITFAKDAPGRDEDGDGYWWFGFDCGHAGDFVPRMLPGLEGLPEDFRKLIKKMEERIGPDFKKQMRSVYRDQQYVVAECQHLAEQLAQIADIMKETISMIPEGGKHVDK